MKINIANAIKAINKDANFSVDADDYNKITWLNNTTPISVEDIKAKQEELKIENTNFDNAKVTGKQKLIDLGLTEIEIKALLGV